MIKLSINTNIGEKQVSKVVSGDQTSFILFDFEILVYIYIITTIEKLYFFPSLGGNSHISWSLPRRRVYPAFL
jgi:hypothetical protein